MQTIYVSNHGDDKNNGLTQEAAVRSWKRYMTLSWGNHELHLMEGDVTFQRRTFRRVGFAGHRALVRAGDSLGAIGVKLAKIY